MSDIMEWVDKLTAKARGYAIHSRPFKMKFRKWYYYLNPKKRRALKWYQEMMNHPDIVAEVYDKTAEKLLHDILYGSRLEDR